MVGVTVGNYKLTGKLGEGGMGTVYVAEHTLIGRKAALKMIKPEYSNIPDVVQRFFTEAKSTAQLKHPCLVEIYDFGHHTNGSAYIVMELLEGETLSQRLRRERRLQSQQIVSIARQICSALKAAHDKNIVHRDLKPDNIFLVPDTEVMSGERVKILDFGIAKLSGESVSKTRTGTLMGTPLYMSPEQCRGAQLVDWRTDIYSLGCIMFEMACGRPPFIGEGFGEIIAAQIHQPPPEPHTIEPMIAPQIEQIIMQALSKKPEVRQQSMAEVAASLDGLFSGRYSTARMMQSPELERAAMEHAKRTGPHGTIAVTPDVPAKPEVVATTPRPTTLRSAAAEVVSDPEPEVPRKSRGGLIAAAVAVVVVGGGIGIVAMNKNKPAPKDDTNVIAVKKQEPEKDKAPPAIVGTAAAEKIKLRIESDPPGAEVYRAFDGLLLGTTPFEKEMDKSQGMASFVIKQAGFEDAKVQLPADRDGATNVSLVKAKETTVAHHGGGTHEGKTHTGGGKTGGKSVLVDPFADDDKPKKKK